MASVWGGDSPSVAWGVNSWAANTFPLDITAPSTLTSSVGDLESFNEEGWGRQEWGNSGWGVEYSVALSGLGLTSSIGTATGEQEIPVDITGIGLTSSLGTPVQGIGVPITAPSTLTSSVGSISEDVYNVGWGRDDWGHEPWGDSDEPVITLTGLGATASVGDLSAFNEQGWGRDPWGYENWGESAMTVVVDVSSSGVGTTAVGSISPTEMAIGLTGQDATSSVGTPGLLFGSGDLSLSGVSATTSVGSISDIEIGVPLTGIGATASVGAITPADVMGLTGVGATSSVGSLEANDAQIIDISGVAATASVGSISPAEMAVGLSGVSATASPGAISPTEMVMGLTGVSATVSVGQVGGPIAWQKVTPSQGGSWSKKTATQGGSWSKVTPP
jgi:hypothetical protein